jgi:ABC-type sugar transport system substrate-binding protein
LNINSGHDLGKNSEIILHSDCQIFLSLKGESPSLNDKGVNVKKTLRLCLYILILAAIGAAYGTTELNQCTAPQHRPVVIFILPDQNAPFWENLVQLTEQANKQFNLDLRFYFIDVLQRDRFNYDKIIDNILSQNDTTDYLVVPFLVQTEQKILSVASKHGIKLLTFNSPLSERVRATVGEPRQPNRNWIAHISPDDEQAGYDMAEQLIRHSNVAADNLKILAISGNRDSEVAEMRNAGLLRKISESKNVRLLQLLSTDWTYAQSREKAKALLKRFKHIDAIWAASDEIAAAVLDELHQSQPGKNTSIAVTSVDWSPRIVPYLKNDEMMSSYGGHVFEGAWLLALIYDYAHQLDFYPQTGAVIHYRLQGMDTKDAELLSNLVDSAVDYKSLSKCLSGNFAPYTFDALELLQQGAQKNQKGQSY